MCLRLQIHHPLRIYPRLLSLWQATNVTKCRAHGTGPGPNQLTFLRCGRATFQAFAVDLRHVIHRHVFPYLTPRATSVGRVPTSSQFQRYSAILVLAPIQVRVTISYQKTPLYSNLTVWKCNYNWINTGLQRETNTLKHNFARSGKNWAAEFIRLHFHALEVVLQCPVVIS